MLWCMVRTSPKALALGSQLRSARDAQNIGVRALAKRIGIDHSTLSRAESGERPPSPELVSTILVELGVSGAELQRIIELSTDTSGTAWLAVSLPEQRAQLAALLDFEQIAKSIVSWSPLLVPGLLQVSSYTRAIMSGGVVPENEIETRVAVRMGRRDVLTRPQPVQMTALLGEGALRQKIGTPEVMLLQLEHLAKMAELPNVDLRIIPFDAGWHPGLDGNFLMLSIDGSTEVVHLENRSSGLFLRDDKDVAVYREAAQMVLRVAMTAEQTAALLADEADRIKKE